VKRKEGKNSYSYRLKGSTLAKGGDRTGFLDQNRSLGGKKGRNSGLAGEMPASFEKITGDKKEGQPGQDPHVLGNEKEGKIVSNLKKGGKEGAMCTNASSLKGPSNLFVRTQVLHFECCKGPVLRQGGGAKSVLHKMPHTKAPFIAKGDLSVNEEEKRKGEQGGKRVVGERSIL